ncbi:hypothetical protein [Chromobacterium phragmitis]|uniref:hypothetical protein n=1 Tax=Chromobacterium phragmitis TaxID=2202141 RepID=UPI0011AE70D0|nr:hypothetical protein [Chromobacterium phragmitis]
MSDCDIQLIELKRGMEIVIPPDHTLPAYSLFCVAAFASVSFDGSPALIRQLLPGLDVVVSAQYSLAGIAGNEFLKCFWPAVEAHLDQFLESDDQEGLLPIGRMELRLSKQSITQDNPVIVIQREWPAFIGQCKIHSV